MMKISSLTIRICPRWKSPWWRIFRPSMSGGSSARRRSCKVARCASSWSTSKRSLSLMPSRRWLNASKIRSARVTISVGPAPHIVGTRRLRRKIGEFVAARKREVHLGDASSGLRHVAQIGDLLLAIRPDVRCSQAGAARRRNGRDTPMSRSRRRPGSRRRHERSRPRLRVSPSTSSTLPSSAGVLAKPATSVRNRPISISGLMPVSSFR